MRILYSTGNFLFCDYRIVAQDMFLWFCFHRTTWIT